MSPHKGKRGSSSWLLDFVWDFTGCLVMGAVLGGICVWLLWIAGQLVTGVME